jgi:ubiquilin
VLSQYKIQPGHTIHMVKGVARSGESSTPQQLPVMQAGQNPSDPLTQLNTHRGFGAMAGVNPFSDMGLNPNDPNMVRFLPGSSLLLLTMTQMQSMLNNPQFLQHMATMMSDPAVVDQLIAMDPQMQAYAPQMRQMFQNPQFREMV